MNKSTFKLEDFKASIKSNGVARSTRFELIITPPISVGSKINSKEISIRCNSGSMPPLNIETKDYKVGQGQIRKMPRNFNQGNEQTFTFYNDYKSTVYDGLNRWAKAVLATNIEKDHSINYYDQFIGSIEVKQLDEQDNVRYHYTLFEAYPISVHAVELNSSDVDNAQLITVQFAYRYARTKDEQNVIVTDTTPTRTRKDRPTSKPALTPKADADKTLTPMPRREKGSGFVDGTAKYAQCKANVTLANGKGQGVLYSQRVQWGSTRTNFNNAYSTGNSTLLNDAWNGMKNTYASISESVEDFFGSMTSSIKEYNSIKKDVPTDDPLHSDVTSLGNTYKEVSANQNSINAELDNFEKMVDVV